MRTVLLALTSLISLLTLFLLLWAAFYFRASGDDLWGAHYLGIHGFWGMNRYQMQHWGGRYTSTFLSLAFFSLGGLNQYWLTTLLLFAVTLPAFYYLFGALLPTNTRKMHCLAFSLILMVLDMVVAKPGAFGGAPFVLVGQYFWNAGAFCYQTSIILLCFILGLLFRHFGKEAAPGLNRGTNLTPRLWTLLVISTLLLCGTNEGAAIMFLLICIYGMWRTYSSKTFNTWFALFFLLLICLAVVYFIPGVQIRMYYYHLKPDLYPYTNDWVLAIGLSAKQLAELFFYYLINPAIWLVSLILYPQLKAIRSRLTELAPMLDLYLMFMGLCFVGFFLAAFAMGVTAVPRYYSVMALIGLFGMMLFCAQCLDWFIHKIETGKKTGPLFPRKRESLSFLLAFIFAVLTLVYFRRYLPVYPAVIKAIKGGPLFVQKYENLLDKVKQAKLNSQHSIAISKSELVPDVPLLSYTFKNPQAAFSEKPTLLEQKTMLVKNMGFYYDVKNIKIE